MGTKEETKQLINQLIDNLPDECTVTGTIAAIPIFLDFKNEKWTYSGITGQDIRIDLIVRYENNK